MNNSLNALPFIREKILGLKPGEACTFSALLIGSVLPQRMLGLAGPLWSSTDVIREGISGSSYDIVHECDANGNVTFQRLLQPLADNRRTHISPDRRHLFKPDEEGYFRPRA